MTGKIEARVANPTIEHVLGRFLADQRGRLAAKTFARYEEAIGLLTHCLNGYAYQALDEKKTALFNRLFDAKGPEHREFCEIFGPEHLLPIQGEFLNYFMVRKVNAGKETLRAAGTVMKKLARWLADNGHVGADDAEDAAERGGRAARDLPKADRLASLLHEFAENQKRHVGKTDIEDHFTITRVAPGKLWLKGMFDRRKLGPIEVPVEISSRCTIGWTISGILGRSGGRWRFIEAWNVYPG